jgi:hypothetical protein
MKHWKRVLIVTVVALVLYFGSFLQFTRHHGALVDMRNGELVYDTPDTFGYRLIRIFYAPLLCLSHSRINCDPGTLENQGFPN